MDKTTGPAAEGRCDSVGRCCVCYNLRRASRAVSRFYDRVLAPAGLRATQFSILMAARNHGPATLTSLADLIVAERTTLTRNLALLERDGLIRADSGADRRERRIAVTDQGLAALERAMPLWDQAQAAIGQGLGPERVARLLDDLAVLVRTVKP
jgi:DNA-binding MarR family transcriptional regulator